MKKNRIITGLTATGQLTLGNYIGSINNIKKMQEKYDDIYLFVADYHALTLPISSNDLRNNIKTNLKTYLAAGIDPKKVKLFIQSQIDGHTELFYLLSNNVYEGELQRMTQFKDKMGKLTKKEKMMGVPIGLYTYPILMAADILLYNANIVPVGDDQKQHLELTRTIVERINNKYNLDFNIPETLTNEFGARIMSLKDPLSKMSKTDKDKSSSIYLLDSEKEIRTKIGSALTDNENKVYYDTTNKPGVSNLITIYAVLENLSIKDAEKKLNNLDYKEFKDLVATTIINVLKPLHEKYNNITDEELEMVLNINKKEIQQEANKNLDILMKGIGLRNE